MGLLLRFPLYSSRWLIQKYPRILNKTGPFSSIYLNALSLYSAWLSPMPKGNLRMAEIALNMFQNHYRFEKTMLT
jgi:hypothetical protein